MPETKIFHLFPNLPPEIRNQIWRFATHLFTLVMDATLIPILTLKEEPGSSAQHIPALLSANSESRSIARDSYSQRFRADPYLPWTDQLRNRCAVYLHANTRPEGGLVINFLTQIFGYDATMELERHLKTLAETWYFWSKILHPREVPF